MNLKKTVQYLSALTLLVGIAGCASNNLATCTIGPLHFHYGEQEQLSQVCYRDTPQNVSAQKLFATTRCVETSAMNIQSETLSK